MAIINVFAGNIFVLESIATPNIKILSVEHTLLLVNNNVTVPYSQSLNSLVPFHQTVHTTYGSYVASLASFLNLGQSTHPKSASLVASNYLALTHGAVHTYGETVTSDLDLQQVLNAALAKHAPSNLNLVQTVHVKHYHSIDLTASLNFGSLVTGYLNNRSFYSTDSPIPSTPATVTPSVCPNGGTAVYPRNIVVFSQGTTNIELPRPEIGNTERYDFTRINRRSRGGDLIVFRDEQWPKTKTLAITFNWLTENQKQDILSFMQTTVGQQVNFQDHYGNTWLGFIMTPANKVTQESRNNKSLSLEFQGVKT